LQIQDQTTLIHLAGQEFAKIATELSAKETPAVPWEDPGGSLIDADNDDNDETQVLTLFSLLHHHCC
jgi:hypothetical protein